MNCGYDDWMDECLSGSSDKWRSRCSRGLSAAWTGVRSPRTAILTLLAFAALLLAFALGCGGNRVVFVPDQSPVRTGPGTKGRVWTLEGGEWRLSGNTVEIPEGMYLVSPRWVEEEPDGK